MASNPFLIDAPDVAMRYNQGFDIGRQRAMQDQAIKDQVAAQQAQAAMMRDINSVSQNPAATAKDYVGLMMRYPSMAGNIKDSLSTLNTAQQQSMMSDMSQIYAAAQNGRADIATTLTQRLYDVAQSSGDEQGVMRYGAMLAGQQADPNYLKNTSGIAMSAVYGDKFADMFPKVVDAQQKVELMPYTTQEAAGKGAEAEAKGALAYESGLTDIESKKEETKSKVLQRSIDAKKLQLEGEKNEIERQKLQKEISKGEAELSKNRKTAFSQAQGKIDGVQDSIDTIDRLYSHSGFSSAAGTGASLEGYLSSSEGAGAKAILDTVRSQQFLSNLMAAKEGGATFGALTEGEAKKLEESVAAATSAQSVGDLKANLDVIRGIMLRRRQDILASGDLPTTGGRYLGKNQKTGAAVTQGMVNAVMMKRPDLTQAQVVNALLGSAQ